MARPKHNSDREIKSSQDFAAFVNVSTPTHSSTVRTQILTAEMADELGSRSLFLTVVQSSTMAVLNVCIAVYRNTRLRTTTNLYIIALAVSDLLSAIFVIPFTVRALISGRWPVCRMNALFSVFVTYVSPVTMGLTAFNRFMRICQSDQQYRRFFSRRKSPIWLTSARSFVISVRGGGAGGAAAPPPPLPVGKK